MPKKISPVQITILAGLLAFFFFIPESISLYVDWLWFKDLRLEKVFTTQLNARIFSAVAGGLLGVCISAVSLWVALRATRGRTFSVQFYGGALPQVDLLKYFNKVMTAAPVVIGVIAGVFFYSNWLGFLYYLNAVPFGYADPIFGKDASFYLFHLPVLGVLADSLFLILILSFAVSLFVYVMKGAMFINQNRIVSEQTPRTHLTVLGSLIFIVLAFKAYIGMYEILYSSGKHVAGATYTDVHAVIPFMKVKIIVAVAVAAVLAANIFIRKRSLVVGGIGLYIVVAFIGGTVYPAILQKFVVAPNELVKETPYIANNIAATRKAFGIDTVEERNISGSLTLAEKDIRENSATIDNIRLWDHKPLLDTFSQVQEIRTYYEFASVDNDRYVINGKYRQTMLSPRELATESIPTRNWINETLTFTHGYGLTLGPVNQVTPEGLPVLLVKDIPPVSAVADIHVTRPEIYFGELSKDHVIVNTEAKEFDYPSGERNVYSEYSGNRGVRIDSLFKKLVFAAHFNSMKLLFSADITKKSRVLYVRKITERVRKAMPFLMLDSDPYMVISDDGKLFWIYDAYTVSRRFPYSQPFLNRINYIRNSVKVTIDAYNGSMVFYLADPEDPVIKTISNIFPGTFRPIEEMPEDLRRHVRYPVDIFGVQTSVYTTYHMEDPQIFYNREDQWEIPVMGADRAREMMEPYYTIMKLPEEEKAEFILMLPFNPKKKDNLSAWMVARSDGRNYGGLVVYRFPKDRLVYGPKQIVARINQDTEISRQISLWDQRGSQVIQGTLLVIPIESSLIYVQPLYLRAETGKIPELKRVIVAYENKIAMEETLDRALSRIFGGGGPRAAIEAPPAAPSVSLPTGEDLAARANEHFARAMKAQREGDWATYGEEIRKLGDVIKEMQK